MRVYSFPTLLGAISCLLGSSLPGVAAVWAWGGNSFGQAGRGPSTPASKTPSPAAVTGPRFATCETRPECLAAMARRFNSMQRVVLAALLTVLGTDSTPARAGTNVWTSIFPDGGAVYRLAVDPQNPGTVYAMTGGERIFKTTDGGGSWNAVTSDLVYVLALVYSRLAIDPQNPSTMYAGGDGILKSTDGGKNWSTASSGLPPPSWGIDGGRYDPVGSLAINPQNPNTIYAVTWGSGLYKSTNGGATWSAANAGLPTVLTDLFSIHAFAIDPKNPNTLYCAAHAEPNGYADYVYKSTDEGVSWSLVANSLAYSFYVLDLAVDPQNTATVYAVGGLLAGSQPWLFRSADGGASWTAASSGLPDFPHGGGALVPHLALDPQHTGTLYLGLNSYGGYSVTPMFKTTDGGTSWTAISSELEGESILALAFESPNTLYAGTDDGVFKSVDGGTSWSTSNRGLHAAIVSMLAVDPQNSGTLYAGGMRRLWKTTDGGASWSVANTGPMGSASALVFDPQDTSTVYARAYRGPFKSTDGGASWTAVNAGIRYAEAYATDLAMDPRNSTTLYAWNERGLYKSTDGAARWSALPLPLTDFNFSLHGLVVDSQEPNTIYMSTSEGVVKSIDGGTSWSRVNFGQPAPGGDYPTIVLSIDPKNSGTLYGISDGAYKSTDGGASWMAVSSGLPADHGVHKIVIDPQNPSTIYGVTLGHGVFRSTDGGASWNAVNSGLTTPYVHTLAIDPQNPSMVYAGTYGGMFAIKFVP